MLIDTHTHLYLDEFQPSPKEAVQRALDAGVGRLVFPNVDMSTIAPMHRLHESFPKCTYMAMGLHPTEITDIWESDLALIKQELFNNSHRYVAIGEIGIDLYWDKTHMAEQLKAFRQQVEWAVELQLPIIIHCRNGLDEILGVFDKVDTIPCGVFHSFGGSAADVERIRQCGDFYFGINGIVTFKNSKLGELLPVIGIERILLETDSPYLAPVPHRGKRNESAYIVHIAEYVASSLGMTVDALSQATTANAMRLFWKG